MSRTRLVITVDSHTQGEPTRLVIGGILHYPGQTMKDRQSFIAREYDSIRKSLMAEPRGHPDMFGGFITPPATEDGDLGIVFMDNKEYLNMCGHGTIGLCTIVTELGWIHATPPRTELKIDTPVGRVLGFALSENGRVSRAGFQNVPSFCLNTAEHVHVDGLGQIEVGIAYGGNFFAIVPAQAVGLDLRASDLSAIKAMGMKIKDAANAQLDIRHPYLQGVGGIDIVTLYGPSANAKATYQNVHVFANGQVDRSPGGTGTSAMLAFLIARREISAAEMVVSEGLAGGLFEGRIVATWQADGLTYHTPEISGIAYLTAINHFYLDSDDPMREGLGLRG